LQGVTKNGVPVTTSIPFLCKLYKELSNFTRKISTGLSIFLMLKWVKLDLYSLRLGEKKYGYLQV
jgi:hypothetical protein